MRHHAAQLCDPGGVDPRRLSEACARAAAAAEGAAAPREAIDVALSTLREGLGSGTYVAALGVDHELLWVLAARGYTMLADGLDVGAGVVGRAVRERRAQLVLDAGSDPDFVEVVQGVVSELALPLLLDGHVVGVLNIETTSRLPGDAAARVGRLAEAVAPAVAASRGADATDLSALARFFAYVSSLRDPTAIGEIVVRAVARTLSLDCCTLVLTGDAILFSACSWETPDAPPLDRAAASCLRARVDPTAVLELLDVQGSALPELAGAGLSSVVVIPLRVAREELGVIVGGSRAPLRHDEQRSDVAALMAAHAAASIDAALALTRERRTALTDPLTGLLNRRGLDEVLELQLDRAQDRRLPLSVLVIDCDDLKDINDRAGHEFGDAALREIGLVLPEAAGPAAQVARLGGDEFAVVLPETDAADGEETAETLRARLVAGLAEAGFPLHVSVGSATYPFDGGAAPQLLRAADQALYEAKASGKNRSVSFRSLVHRSASGTVVPRSARGDRAGSGVGTNVLSEAFDAAGVIWEESTVDGVLERLAKSITFVLGASACAISRVEGDRIIDACSHALREIDLGMEGAYLIDDFPITKDVLTTGRSKSISFLDEDLDRGEAFVLRELRMNCCLLVSIRVNERAWGLVEVYDMRLRRFEANEQAAAEFLVGHAGRRLAALGGGTARRRRMPLFRVPTS